MHAHEQQPLNKLYRMNPHPNTMHSTEVISNIKTMTTANLVSEVYNKHNADSGLLVPPIRYASVIPNHHRV